MLNEVKGIYSRDINLVVFDDGAVKSIEPDLYKTVNDDGELAELLTEWALSHSHIRIGQSIAVI
jgi:hypothetical protein